MNKKIDDTVKSSSTKNLIKLMVSKKKKRFDYDGYNLDLSYITDQIIAMGFPAEKFESFYRNSME